MEQSPRLSLAYVMPAQAQKHVTVNETFRRLDALVQLSVLSRSIAAEPAEPGEGDAHILPAAASGDAWSGLAAGAVVHYQDNAWLVAAPVAGMRAWIADEAIMVVHDGTAWTPLGDTLGGAFSAYLSGGSATTLGVNTSADATNKLAVKSDAVLFSHDDVTPGTGAVSMTMNKKAAADDASMQFQTNWSGRAALGLTGDDNFRIKVSADGQAFKDAVYIDAATGNVGIGQTGAYQELDVWASGAQTGYYDIAAFKISNDAQGAAHTRILLGQNAVNDGFVEVADQSGARGRLLLQPFGGPVAVGAGQMSQTAKLHVGGGGVVVGAPTGGDKGAGTVNAEAVFDDNALLSCYVFDQFLDGSIHEAKWDALAPARGDAPRRHQPMRRFKARIGGADDPLTLDGYARHWRCKRHLTSMPNEAAFDPGADALTTGEWIQRLVETAEIQAVLIEMLNQRTKSLAGAAP